uniref:Titin n=1 Tax=Cacopsylla melanoneura TaxID=428564 RepID=A0A8D8XRW6_9HEMI
MGIAEDFAPSFTQKPQLRQEDEGNRLIFECQLLSNPKPDIVWFRGDTQLAEDTRTVMKTTPIGSNKYTVALELDDVIETDAGLYKVKAKNKMGEVAASINLNFSPADDPAEKQIDGLAPTFLKKPSIRQEDDGKRLLFECRIQADPTPTVIWSHSGIQVKEDKRHKFSIEKDGHSYFASLEIIDVTIEDAGKYKVTAKNELGESNATISLNFDSGENGAGFAPSFIEKPRIIPNEDGTLIQMKCKCSAKPKPEVTWYKADKVVKESSKIKIIVNEKDDTYEIICEITDPIGPDSGTYRCNVKNEFGESNANLNLNIEAEAEPEGDPPTFIEKPKIRSEQGGKLVVMECKVKAKPMPEILWFHEGKVLEQSDRISWTVTLKGDKYHIRLEVKDPRKEDTGLYKCNIKNFHGELNANLTLNIEIVPVIREVPKVVTISKKKTVVIECKVMSMYEPSVTWMKEKSSIKEDNKHVVHIEQVKDGEFNVKLEMHSVTDKDKGTYKLVAKNEKGEVTSAPVEVTEIPETIKEEKPKIASKLKAVTVTEGQTAEFECSLTTIDRKITVIWYKNNVEVRETKDVTVTFDGKSARLKSVNTKFEASGIYKVVFSNSAGSDESSTELRVNKKEEEKEEEKKEEEKKKEKKKRRRRWEKRLEKDEDIVFLHFLQDVLRNLVLCSILNHLFTLIEYEIEIYLVHLTWDSLNPLVFVFETYPRPVLPDENIIDPYAEGKKITTPLLYTKNMYLYFRLLRVQIQKILIHDLYSCLNSKKNKAEKKKKNNNIGSYGTYRFHVRLKWRSHAKIAEKCLHKLERYLCCIMLK